MNKRMRTTVQRLLMVTVVITGIACGGGGGGGGGGGPTQPPPGINFSASSAATQNSCYLKQGGATNPNRLFLEVQVNNVSDWYGVAFDLFYPGQALSFAKVVEGGFPGGSTDLIVTEVSPGHLVVGHTRLGDIKGRNGSGLLMTLQFTSMGSGSGSVNFGNEQAFGTNSFPMAVTFIGGTVTVAP